MRPSMRSCGWHDALPVESGWCRRGCRTSSDQLLASASTAPSVRSTSGILKALCSVVRAPRRGGRRRAWRLGQARVGLVHPPGLGRDAADRDAARAVRLDDRPPPTRQQRRRTRVAHLAVDVAAAERGGRVTAVTSSPVSSAVSTSGVSPGRRGSPRWGSRGSCPSGFTVSTERRGRASRRSCRTGWWRCSCPDADDPRRRE